MSNKKITDVMLDRIKYFINAIENGDYEPKAYEFTINLKYEGLKHLTINDNFNPQE